MHRINRTLAALGTAGATALALAASPTIAAAQPASVSAITWEECPPQVDVDSAQCGRVTVPTYYDNPAAGTITVGFVKVPAANPSARRGALFTNPGGPGGDAYSFAANSEVAWPKGIRQEWDIIGVQPRGLPGSTPLTCVTKENLGTMPSPQQLFESYTASGKATRDNCERHTPGYTNAITTENTARDWDAVRQALGEERISIMGLSYGTLLGSVYATQFPQHTDRLVLDSAVDPGTLWARTMEAQVPGYKMAYDDFFAFVARNDATYHLGTTPLAVYESWSRKVQAESGIRPTVLPPNAQVGDLPPGLEIAGQPGADLMSATGPLRVNAQAAADAATSPGSTLAASPTFHLTRMMVPMPDKWESMARHIAGQEDLTAAASAGPDAAPTEEQQVDIALAQLNATSMQNVMICNEAHAPGNPAYIPEMFWSQFVTGDSYSAFTSAYTSGLGCAGRGPVTPPVTVSGTGLATRPLQISGTRDPQTPYWLHDRMARDMGAHVITVNGPGHGHVAAGNAAVDDAVVAYLRDGHTDVTQLPGRH